MMVFTSSLRIKYWRHSELGQSFQAAAPYLWNRLPREIRLIKSLDKYKKAIKTFLLVIINLDIL